MPITRSAAKRMRADAARRLRRLRVTSELKTLAKQFETSYKARQPAPAAEALRRLTKRLDMASRKGIVHRKAAARKKARLNHRLAQMAPLAPTTPAA